MNDEQVMQLRSTNVDLEEVLSLLSTCLLIANDHRLKPLTAQIERAFAEALFAQHDREAPGAGEESMPRLTSELAHRYSDLLGHMEKEFAADSRHFIVYLIKMTRRAIAEEFPEPGKNGDKIIRFDAKDAG